jgi:hypothetical protein
MVARLASITKWHQKVAGSSPAVVNFAFQDDFFFFLSTCHCVPLPTHQAFQLTGTPGPLSETPIDELLSNKDISGKRSKSGYPMLHE